MCSNFNTWLGKFLRCHFFFVSTVDINLQFNDLFLDLELFCTFTKDNGSRQTSSAGPEGFNRQQRLGKGDSGVHLHLSAGCLICVCNFVLKHTRLSWVSKAVPKRKQWSATQSRGPKRVKVEVKSTQTEASQCLVDGMSAEAYDLMVKGRSRKHNLV